MRLIPKWLSEALEARRVLPEVAQALNDAENEIERLQNEAAGFVRKLETAHSERDSYKALADNLNRQIGGFKEEIERLTRESQALGETNAHLYQQRMETEAKLEKALGANASLLEQLKAAKKKPAVKKTAKKGAK